MKKVALFLLLFPMIAFAGVEDTLFECRPDAVFYNQYRNTSSRETVMKTYSGTDFPDQAEWDACEAAASLRLLKSAKKEEIKAEGLALMQVQLPGITSFEAAEAFKEFISSVAPAARQLTAKVQSVSDIWTAGASMISAINALTTEQEVIDYVVTWP